MFLCLHSFSNYLQTQIVREPCDAGAELHGVAEFYEPAAAEVGVRLTVDVAGPVAARLDRPLFQRAVGNLVANALAHTQTPYRSRRSRC